VATDFFMGDLFCDTESVPMEGHDISSIGKDDLVLLEKALPPAGQTLCSCGELHDNQDGTHQQCINGDSLETEVDIPGSPSSGTKRGEGGDGNSQSHVVSEYSEPKESSSHEPSPSFLVSLNLLNYLVVSLAVP
jgi:hypothetical protein